MQRVAYLDIDRPQQYVVAAQAMYASLLASLRQQVRKDVEYRFFAIHATDDKIAAQQVSSAFDWAPQVVLTQNLRLAEMALNASPSVVVVTSSRADPFAHEAVMNGRREGRLALVSLYRPMHQKRIEIAKMSYPGRRIIGVVVDGWNNQTLLGGEQFLATLVYAGFEPHVFYVENESDYLAFLSDARRRKIDIWYVPVSYAAFVHRERFVARLAEHGAVSIWDDEVAVRWGGSMAYSADRAEYQTRLAKLCAAVINGTPPQELSVELPSTYRLRFNPAQATPKRLLLRASP